MAKEGDRTFLDELVKASDRGSRHPVLLYFHSLIQAPMTFSVHCLLVNTVLSLLFSFYAYSCSLLLQVTRSFRPEGVGIETASKGRAGSVLYRVQARPFESRRFCCTDSAGLSNMLQVRSNLRTYYSKLLLQYLLFFLFVNPLFSSRSKAIKGISGVTEGCVL